MANIYEVAQRAGVSTSTVSRALRDDPRIRQGTKDRVVQAARELSYVPQAAAQVLAGKKLRTLGLVLPHIEGAYYAELTVGFETRAGELDMSVVLVLANPRTDQAAALSRLVGQVDGVAFMAMSAASDEMVAEVAKARPTVTAARSQIDGVPALFADGYDNARKLTAHLLECGRSRLAFIGPVDSGSDIETRYLGYCDALADAGMEAADPIVTDMDEEHGRVLARELVKRGLEYDALVCGNDEIAVALVDEMSELGVKVPEELAIVGWDDIRVSRYLRPRLTTVSQPVYRLGELAAEHLANLVDGKEVPDTVVLPTEIVHRESCGCVTEAGSRGSDSSLTERSLTNND